MRVVYVLTGWDKSAGWLCCTRGTFESGKAALAETKAYFMGLGYNPSFEYAGGNEIDPDMKDRERIQWIVKLVSANGKNTVEYTLTRAPVRD